MKILSIIMLGVACLFAQTRTLVSQGATYTISSSWDESIIPKSDCFVTGAASTDLGGMCFHTNNTENAYALIDLGSSKEFNEIDVATRNDGGFGERLNTLTVSYSDDATTWTKVWDANGTGPTTAWTINGFGNVSARYIQFALTENNYLALASALVYSVSNDPAPVYGCTDSTYEEYNPEATEHDNAYCQTLKEGGTSVVTKEMLRNIVSNLSANGYLFSVSGKKYSVRSIDISSLQKGVYMYKSSFQNKEYKRVFLSE